MSLAIAQHADHDIVLRVTGDDIMCDPHYIGETIASHRAALSDYTDAKALPSGTEVEVFDADTLKFILKNSVDSEGTEYLTNYITDNPMIFETNSLVVDESHRIKARLTVDTAEDYELVSGFIQSMAESGKELSYNLDDIRDYFEFNPELIRVNQNIVQKSMPLVFNSSISSIPPLNKELVTVYIVNHNYEQYVRESIESVLRQTYDNIQLIIIDDGSTDESFKLLDYYENVYDIQVVRNENQGLIACCNQALRLAKGAFVVRLDADDFMHENMVELLVAKIVGNPDIVAVVPNYAVIDKHGKVMRYEERSNFETEVTLYDNPAHGACTLIRKDSLLAAGGYNEDYLCQDGWDAWLKLIPMGSVTNVELPLFFYRMHGENLTKDKGRLLHTRSQILANHLGEIPAITI